MIRDIMYFKISPEKWDEILIPLLFSDNSVIEHFTLDIGQLIPNSFSVWVDMNTDLQL